MHGGHHHSHHSPEPRSHVPPEHARLMRLATMASVSVATLLVIGKLIVWWISDSLAMLSSLTDSMFDVATSLMNFIAVRYALKPADNEHRFGHTGIEDIAGLAQFLFIVGAMLVIILQSVERLFNPEPLAHEWLGIAVSGFAICFTAGLVAYQSYVARITKSLVVSADRMHYASDLLFNLGVLLAFFLSMQFGFTWADPAFALLMACTVLWLTRDIGVRAFNNLMNREMPASELARIRTCLEGLPDIKGVHDLRTRHLGTKAIIQLEVDIDKTLSFDRAHHIAHDVEEALRALYPHADVMVHPNPV